MDSYSVRNGMSMYDFSGVALEVKDKSSIPESAKAIVSAFRSAGLNLEIVQILRAMALIQFS